MQVHEDFFSYRSGVYRQTRLRSSSRTAYHSVRILGWGEEAGYRGLQVKYWVSTVRQVKYRVSIVRQFKYWMSAVRQVMYWVSTVRQVKYWVGLWDRSSTG